MTKRHSSKKGASTAVLPTPPEEVPPGDRITEDDELRHEDERINEMIILGEESDREFAEYRAIDERVKGLRDKATRGDKSALSMLHHIAKASTEALYQLSPADEGMRNIAGREYYWPMLMPNYMKDKDDPRMAYLGKLQLARFLPLDPGKFLRTETTARLVVEFEVQLLEKMVGPGLVSPVAPLNQNRGLVPPAGLRPYDKWTSTPALPNPFGLGELTLQKESIERWFDAIKILVLQQTGENPTSAEFPDLRKIGQHHEGHGGAEPGTKTAEGNIRRRFFEQLKKALQQVVRERKPSLPAEGIRRARDMPTETGK